MDRNTHWENYGTLMGYPPCCIEAFLKGEQTFNCVFSGTGFLPCGDCNKLPPEKILKYIDTHRQSATIFPFDNEQDKELIERIIPEVLEFINTLRNLTI